MTRYVIYGVFGTILIGLVVMTLVGALDQQGLMNGDYNYVLLGSVVIGFFLSIWAAHASNAKRPDSSVFDNRTGVFLMWFPVGAFVSLLVTHHYHFEGHPLWYGLTVLAGGLLGCILINFWLRWIKRASISTQ